MDGCLDLKVVEDSGVAVAVEVVLFDYLVADPDSTHL